jgi:parallel beta-helix repeat protein
MTDPRPLLTALLGALLSSPALAQDPVLIEPGPGVEERLQEALILAEPGGTIQLAAGTYELSLGLSLTVDRVTLRGAGIDDTVLDFSGQEAGSEGLLVTSHGVLLEDFAVVGSPGDGIKVRDARGITLRRVRASWPESLPTNGGYGLYPVGCHRVLIEDCVARGASDAGIYVGQSRQVIVRRCVAERNVAGIEVENSRHVDVHDNLATHNTGGILVFDLPNLPVQGGGHVRVFDNQVLDNDTPNFAPEGNIVALVPRGTGLLIMANRGVEVFGNTVRGHATTNVLVASYVATGLPIEDPDYWPFPEGIHIHDNALSDCGGEPDGQLGLAAAMAAGVPLPDVVWDGVVAPDLAGGEVPLERRLVLRDNGDADFVNLDLPALLADPEHAQFDRDLAAHQGELPALAPADLEERNR